MGAPSLHRNHIGHIGHGPHMLAEVIRGKVFRAREKREAILVLVNDNGEVFAGYSTSSLLMLSGLRNPGWVVGCYSMAFPHNRECAPSVAEIAEDLTARAKEVLSVRRAA